MESMSFTYIVVGAACFLAALSARPLVNFNLVLYRKVGLPSLAAAWERRLGWWIPVVRVIAAGLAFGFFLLSFGLFRSG